MWVAAAGAVGFASAFVFSDVLALPRRWFLVPHAIVTIAFLLAYARWSGTELRRLFSRRFGFGALGALVLGAMLSLNVLGQQPSQRAQGLELWLDLAWLGVVYGALDALLLSVLPVVAAWRACAQLGWTRRWRDRLGAAALGIVASAYVTSAYHAGYAEFRAPNTLAKAVAGNAMMSSAQLLTASPVAATGSHIIMHIAAVLHGPDTTVQLPPHRARRSPAL